MKRLRIAAFGAALLLSTFSLVGLAAQAPADSIDVSFDGADIGDAMRVLGELGQYNVIVDQEVKGTVSFRLQDMTVEEAIDLVARTSGYGYRIVGKTLVVGLESTLRDRFDDIKTRIVEVRFADLEQLASILAALFPNVEARVDPTQRALILRGDPRELDEAERAVATRDVRPLVNREFVNAPLRDIFKALSDLGGYNLIVNGELDGIMTIVLRDRTAEEAIDTVARRGGVTYAIDGPDLIVAAVPRTEEAADGVVAPIVEARDNRVFRLVHVAPARILDAVQIVIGDGTVWTDQESKTMIVSATTTALRRVEDLVATLDAPDVRVQGVLRQGDQYAAILLVNEESYVVRPGTTVASLRVVDVRADEVVLETAHGHELRVAAGRK